MASSNSRKSETSPSPSSAPQFTTANFIPIPASPASAAPKTVDDVWREIVAGDRRECKEEAPDDDHDKEMMTLEDFLAQADAVDQDYDNDDIKMPMPLTERLDSGNLFSFDHLPTTPFHDSAAGEGSVIGFGNGVEVVEGGRGKRPRPVLEQLDKAAQQRQRRMIKNRESAARSRERKQAYQVELESLAVKLEEENDKLLKEKPFWVVNIPYFGPNVPKTGDAERKKERYKQLMEKVLPIAQKQKPPCILRRARSLQW